MTEPQLREAFERWVEKTVGLPASRLTSGAYSSEIVQEMWDEGWPECAQNLEDYRYDR